MKDFRLYYTAFALCMTVAFQPCSAAEGDRSIYTSTSSDGGGVIMTNKYAQDMNRTIRQSQDGRYVYKNYTRLSPRGAAASSTPAPSALKTPYSHYDASFVSNAHKIMEPIIVTCAMGSVDITPIIIKEAQEHNIDPFLIRTVIKYESGFCATAVSPVGACGLMQLMPDTASGLGVRDVYSPYDNIAGGVHYIRRQLDNFNNNVAFALAAYNAGPGAVMEYGGIPPYEETQNYVRMIMGDYLSQGRVARRIASPAASGKSEPARKIDMLSTLSRMKGSPVSAKTAAPAGETAVKPQMPDMIPIMKDSAPAAGLLENRSNVQGNPLENRPSVTVPGY